jgi:hypothetical protein
MHALFAGLFLLFMLVSQAREKAPCVASLQNVKTTINKARAHHAPKTIPMNP